MRAPLFVVVGGRDVRPCQGRGRRRLPDGYMERNRGDLRPFAWWFGFVLDIACKRAQIRPEGLVGAMTRHAHLQGGGGVGVDCGFPRFRCALPGVMQIVQWSSMTWEKGACLPKASATYAPKYFDSLEKVGSLLGVPEDSQYVIYGGSEVLETRHGHVLSLREAHRLVM